MKAGRGQRFVPRHCGDCITPALPWQTIGELDWPMKALYEVSNRQCISFISYSHVSVVISVSKGSLAASQLRMSAVSIVVIMQGSIVYHR